MNKERSLLFWLLLAAALGGFHACAHKPAYSDIEPNRVAANRNQDSNQNTEGRAPAEPRSPADAAQPAPPSPSPQAIKSPSFMDQAKGDIKDLPAYPRAYRVSAQIGPIQGVNVMSLSLKSTDPMDKITAYYDQVIKDNKWTVTDKIIDPEFSEWSLKKGEEHSAKVQVKKDPKTRAMDITIVRGEKLEGAGK